MSTLIWIVLSMIGDRLKVERKRLGLNQDGFAAIAGVTRRPYAEWESGNTSPTGVQLAQMAAAGADILYIVTGERRGDGIGESAVHQAVLDAVDLLSLDKKLDSAQLAKAVVKLCQRAAPAASTQSQSQTQHVTSHGGQVTQSGQIINQGEPPKSGGKR